jgi:four helix bundle protein
VAKGDDIQDRLISLAVSVSRLCAELPKSREASHMAGQLVRCGTSAAPNYGEAQGAESTKDFIHKLGIVLKELNECAIWLEMIRRAELHPSQAIGPLLNECKELCRIIAASIRTASGGKPSLARGGTQ